MTLPFSARAARDAVAEIVASLTGEKAAEILFDLALPRMEPERLRSGSNWSMQNYARSNRLRLAIERAVVEIQSREPTMEDFDGRCDMAHVHSTSACCPI